MVRVKWDTLKEKALMCIGPKFQMGMPDSHVAAYALLGGLGDGSFNWKKNYDELWERCKAIVERWDVRRAKALIDLFPGIVPKRFVGRVPRCYMADTPNADWIVEFEE